MAGGCNAAGGMGEVCWEGALGQGACAIVVPVSGFLPRMPRHLGLCRVSEGIGRDLVSPAACIPCNPCAATKPKTNPQPASYFLPPSLQEEEQLKAANATAQAELEALDARLGELRSQHEELGGEINALKKAAAQHSNQGACGAGRVWRGLSEGRGGVAFVVEGGGVPAPLAWREERRAGGLQVDGACGGTSLTMAKHEVLC